MDRSALTGGVSLFIRETYLDCMDTADSALLSGTGGAGLVNSTATSLGCLSRSAAAFGNVTPERGQSCNGGIFGLDVFVSAMSVPRS